MDILSNFLKEKGLFSQSVIEKFSRYKELLLEWNEKFNLTAITDDEGIQIKHFIDSIYPYHLINDNSTLIDIGSGAGFPSIPLAIVLPKCKFTLIDSLNKRVNFLNEVVKELNLTNCNNYHARAEEFIANNREKYDYAIARGVANMSTLAEYTLPYLKVGGELIAYKGDCKDELDSAANALKLLKGKVKNIEEFTLPNGDSRSVVVITKFEKTPKQYPRSGNKPRTLPL